MRASLSVKHDSACCLPPTREPRPPASYIRVPGSHNAHETPQIYSASLRISEYLSVNVVLDHFDLAECLPRRLQLASGAQSVVAFLLLQSVTTAPSSCTSRTTSAMQRRSSSRPALPATVFFYTLDTFVDTHPRDDHYGLSREGGCWVLSTTTLYHRQAHHASPSSTSSPLHLIHIYIWLPDTSQNTGQRGAPLALTRPSSCPPSQLTLTSTSTTSW